MTNLPMPMKKSSAPQSAKPKSTKKGDDSSKTCSDIVPFESSLPPIGNTALESSPPSARTRSSKHPTTSKSRPTAPRPSVDTPTSSRTQGRKRKTSPPPTFATAERRVCYL